MHSNGNALIGKTKEFKAPIPEQKIDSVTEGRIIEAYRENGFKVSNFSWRQEGMTGEQATANGVEVGEFWTGICKEAVNKPDGSVSVTEHEITGRIIKSSKSSVKINDEEVWETEGVVATYKMTVDGTLVHDIDVAAQRVTMFGKDLTSKFVEATQ